MVGKAAPAPARARDALVALGITLALLLIAGFTRLALAYAVKSGIDGKWTDAYDAAKRGGEGVIGLGFVVYVWARYGLVAVRRTWFSTAEIARDRASGFPTIRHRRRSVLRRESCAREGWGETPARPQKPPTPPRRVLCHSASGHARRPTGPATHGQTLRR